ncbi:MAG: ATP-binding protein, partial [Candidatus Dojkabacteria bacterium]
ISDNLVDNPFYDFENLSSEGILVKGRVHRIISYIDAIDADDSVDGKDMRIDGVYVEFRDETKNLRERGLSYEHLVTTQSMTIMLEHMNGITKMISINGELVLRTAEIGDIVGFSKAILKEDLPKLETEVNKIIIGGQSEVEFEIRITNFEGKVIWVLVKLICENPKAKKKILRGFITDITKLHDKKEIEARREAQLQVALNLNSIQNYAVTFDDMGDPIFTSIDSEEDVGEWRDKEDTDEFNALKLDPFFRFIHPDDREKALQEFQKLKLGIPIQIALRIKTKDKASGEEKIRTVENYAIPMLDDEGNFTSAVGGFIDVTDVVEKGTLERLLKFLTVFAHDSKAPLFTIRSATDLIQKVQDSDDPAVRDKYTFKVPEWFNNINLMVAQLSENVEAMLLLVSAQISGENIIQLKNINAPAHFKTIIEESIVSINGRNFIINIPDVDLIITTDTLLIKHVILNLITNAAKYSAEGSNIEINMDIHPDKLILSVRDYGIGIPEDFQPKILNELGRARNVKDIDGTGIGLAMVKQILDLLKYKIYFESTVNVGTTFFIEIPLVKTISEEA